MDMRFLSAIFLFGFSPFQAVFCAESDTSRQKTLTALESAGAGKPAVIVDNPAIVPARSAASSAARSAASSAVFEFHIPAHTGARPWNTPAGMVRLTVGRKLRIVNDDNTIHQLHTDGFICLNDKFMAPGESYDCLLTQPYDPDVSGPLYNAIYGPLSSFWIEVSE